ERAIAEGAGLSCRRRDEFDAAALQLRDGRVEVRHAEGEVIDAGRIPWQVGVTTRGRRLRRGLEDVEVDVAEVQRALILRALAGEAQHLRVERHRAGDVTDGDADVVERFEHRPPRGPARLRGRLADTDPLVYRAGSGPLDSRACHRHNQAVGGRTWHGTTRTSRTTGSSAICRPPRSSTRTAPSTGSACPASTRRASSRRCSTATGAASAASAPPPTIT